MPRSATRLRKMIAGLRTAGLDTDEIARRAMIARGAVYRFRQGDSRALVDSFGRIAILYEKVTVKRGAAARVGQQSAHRFAPIRC